MITAGTLLWKKQWGQNSAYADISIQCLQNLTHLCTSDNQEGTEVSDTGLRSVGSNSEADDADCAAQGDEWSSKVGFVTDDGQDESVDGSENIGRC